MSEIFDKKRDEFNEAALAALKSTNELLDEADKLVRAGNAGTAEEFFEKAWENTRFIVFQVIRRRIRVHRLGNRILQRHTVQQRSTDVSVGNGPEDRAVG